MKHKSLILSLVILAVVAGVVYVSMRKPVSEPVIQAEPLINDQTSDQIAPTAQPIVNASEKQSINLTFPRKGDRLIKGKTYDITWEATAFSYPEVDINIFASKGLAPVTPNLNVTTDAKSGSYKWTIPADGFFGPTGKAIDEQTYYALYIVGHAGPDRGSPMMMEGSQDYSEAFFIVSE